MTKTNTKRVMGFSAGVGDALAVAGIVAGVLTTIFAGQSIGSLVLAATGSIWLGTCAWVGVMLIGATLILSGFAYLVSVSRSYRYPGDAKVEVDA